MNPVFWALVIVAAVFFWMVLSPIFWIVGDFISGLWKNAKREMRETDENKEDE